MEHFRTDAIVIGAGVVGLAVARALALGGMDVVVLERHACIGSETSSRNSEVIHAGLYYPPASLKAQHCVRGRDLLYAFCRQHGVPFRQPGKWLVAVTDEEVPVLEHIARTAAANGVCLQPVSRLRMQSDEPALNAVAALESPLTGIIDSHALMLALQGSLEAGGGTLVLNAPVESIVSSGAGHEVQIGGATACVLSAPRLVNAAGLSAWEVSSRWRGMPAACIPAAWFARGVYFALSGRSPFSRLIYPMPQAGGLGIHLTLDLAGQARFGPDVEWISAPDYRLDAGRREAFLAAIRRYWPAVSAERLLPAYAGVRPKLSGPAGLAADFVLQDESVHGLPGALCLYGIESPGLTACLSLAEAVACRLGDG